jgi:ATP-binding cassette, subfamily B, multidrug efflux pump
LLRMMEVQKGNITVDGVNLYDLNLVDYKAKIGYAPQDIFMFSDTIANNISFGVTEAQSLLDDEIRKAADHAALTEAIVDFPNGFQTMVGERGITLSGGQKQRVSIARAIVKNPDLLIFDDCLSAVDTKTEALILENFKQILKGKTTVLISHRVSTVKHADMILVLNEGVITERGNHSELMTKEGQYYTLYQKQLMEEHNIGA